MPEVYVTEPLVPGTERVGGDGSEADPYHSVGRALERAQELGGGVVRVGGGHYVEQVAVTGFGLGEETLLVTPHGDGEVFIDGCLPEFLAPEGPEQHWHEVDPQGDEAGGEFVWRQRFGTADHSEEKNRVRVGAFYDEPVHTRLVGYDRREDLTAPGQIWPRDQPQPGKRVWRPHPDQEQFPGVYQPENRPEKPTYRPWVYMGPGIWFDQEFPVDPDDPDSEGRRVHIRVGPTTNNIPGWPDYDPDSSDPNEVRLALSLDETHAVFLKNCHHVRFEDLTLRFGCPDTVRLNGCSDIVFDRCRIRSGPRAIYLTNEANTENRDICIEHCEIDGGIPTWFFRSDRKDEYVYGPDAPDEARRTKDQLEEDQLGYSTSGVQISGEAHSFGTLVHHCEIYNAHDSYVFGDGMEFHHNWVHNLNDDGIAVSARAHTKNAKIHCNVITQCLTALSFAAKEVGTVSIYGNLFDLRQPTLGIRPTGDGSPDSLRQGHFFKDGADEGPIDLFHNTCLVRDPGAKGDDLTDINDAGFAYYSAIGASLPRRAYNNIMVAIFTPAAPPAPRLNPIAFLAPKSFESASDGNTFFRIPSDDEVSPHFLVRRRRVEPENHTFSTLEDYRAHYWPADVGGYEEFSTREDPGFKSFDSVTGQSFGGDDLRLRLSPESPAKDAAVAMPQDLTDLYVAATGTEPLDRGCYPSTGARLRVGVGGRRIFPRIRPGVEPDTHSTEPQVVVADD